MLTYGECSDMKLNDLTSDIFYGRIPKTARAYQAHPYGVAQGRRGQS